MSNPKEPYYFADDFPKMRQELSGIDSFEKYMNLFANANDEHVVIGEASTIYLYSRHAINNIYQFNPRAQLLILLRNPINLVQAFHSQLLRFNIEDVNDFDKAWSLQNKRKQMENLPKKFLDVKLFYIFLD